MFMHDILFPLLVRIYIQYHTISYRSSQTTDSVIWIQQRQTFTTCEGETIDACSFFIY